MKTCAKCGGTNIEPRPDRGTRCADCKIAYGRKRHAQRTLGSEAESLCRTYAYSCWASMMARCYRPAHVAYARYGGSGVAVAVEWHEPRALFAAIGYPPSFDHTLDRESGAAGYVPGNVRWATKAEQSINRRNTRYVLLDGARVHITLAARIVGRSRTYVLQHYAVVP